jgi:hypothetical protein
MDLRWLARRHEEIVTKEREQEQHEMMKTWERRRAAVEEESMRNQEATRFTSVASRRVDPGIPPRPPKEPEVVNVVDVAPQGFGQDDRGFCMVGRLDDLEKLRDFRRLNRHIFRDTSGRKPSQASSQQDKVADEFPTLSPYPEFQGENAPISQYKQRCQEELPLQNISKIWNERHQTFAEAFGSEHVTPTLESMRRSQLEEVDAIKRSFGHHNVPCNAAVLERALVIPPQQYRPDVGFAGLVPRLLINPFYDPEGGKGKKKGRGRGRKKK